MGKLVTRVVGISYANRVLWASVAVANCCEVDVQEMVKLSISLPNSTQITLESDEFDVISRVLSMLLQDTAHGAVATVAPAGPAGNSHDDAVEKGTDANGQSSPVPPHQNGGTFTQPLNGIPSQHPAENGTFAVPSNGTYRPQVTPSNDSEDDGLFLEAFPMHARDDFVAFCQNVNPMGDMRRVVVAAEGASRFFRADGVNADELGELFDLIGWRRANSFTQTLRNAARSKFGWLERIPGRSGRYAATDLGRSVTMGG